MSALVTVTRRGFLGGLVTTSAFMLGCRLMPGGLVSETSSGNWEPSVYLAIEPDGRVVIIAHRSEMGTGIRTVLPTIVADELEADWKQVSIVQALGDQKYGSQNTDGSCSIRDFYDAMRKAGATARTMLERAAAAGWNVPVEECRAQNHKIVHVPSKREASFGSLVAAASKLPVPATGELRFKSPSEYRYIGKDVPIVDLADLCNGRGTFGMDLKVPGMVYASIERPPVLGATLKSHDDSETKKVAGVEQTVVLEGITYPIGMKPVGGVAVIASNTWSAMRGRQRLKAEWDPGPHGTFNSATEKAEMIATAQRPQKVVRNGGDVDAAFAKATRVHEAQYYTPMLSHAPMEPPVAVASVQGGKAEIWAPTQNPQAVQEVVGAALGIRPADVTCHVSLLGGGFGRKSFPDYCAEAALLSRKIGKPVKVVWSRQEDLQSDFYHTASALYMKAALDAKGKPTAWLQRTVFPPIGSISDANEQYGGSQLSMGWTDVPFDIPNFRAENGPAKAHVRVGWLRSVANIYHAFAVQSFIDELAHAAKRDPIEYSLEALGADRKLDLEAQGVEFQGPEGTSEFAPDTARLRRVIELVAERSGWANRKPTKNHAWGFAAHRSFLSYIATVVEVSIDDQGAIHIPRVDIAVDCGRVISPDRVTAQFEGASVFGAGLALVGEITAEAGRIQQANFNNYRVARMTEAPYRTNVHIVPSEAAPAGVGEPGVPPMAPALCNAIFAATGKRVRELPIKNTKLV
jgi:isoquinoline 1-oxidoreductase beta subunit